MKFMLRSHAVKNGYHKKENIGINYCQILWWRLYTFIVSSKLFRLLNCCWNCWRVMMHFVHKRSLVHWKSLFYCKTCAFYGMLLVLWTITLLCALVVNLFLPFQYIWAFDSLANFICILPSTYTKPYNSKVCRSFITR